MFHSEPYSVLRGVHTQRLPNGITAVLDPGDLPPYAVLGCCFASGAASDPAGRTGLTHFLEHMMFKGTPRYSEAAVSAWLVREGATQNALTSYDFTLYHKTVPSAALMDALDLELDRLENLQLDPGTVDVERAVILNEILTTHHSWATLLGAAQMQLLAGTGYAHPVIGHTVDVRRIGAEDMRAHHAAYHRTDQLIVSVSGHFDAGDVLHALQQVPARPPAPPVGPTRGSSATVGVLQHDPAQRRLVVALPSAPVTALTFPIMVVLDAVLCGVTGTGFFAGAATPGPGARGLLGVALQRAGLATYVAGGLLPTRAGFMWPIRVEYSSTTSLDVVLRAIHATFAHLQREPISAPHLQQILKGLRAQLTFSLDSRTRRAWSAATWQAIAGLETFQQLPEQLGRVTAHDLQRLAQAHLHLPESSTPRAVGMPS